MTQVGRRSTPTQAGFLEVTDDEGVVSCPLRVQSVADGLRRAAEFRQRMEEVIGRIEAMDLEPDAGTGGCVEQRLQPLDVGRLLDRMDEALIPQPGGTGRFGHTLSPASTLRLGDALCPIAHTRCGRLGNRSNWEKSIIGGANSKSRSGSNQDEFSLRSSSRKPGPSPRLDSSISA